MPGWKSAVGRRLDALIVRAVPGVQKAVKYNSPIYGMEREAVSSTFHVFTRYVKVAFFSGASLGRSRRARLKHKIVRYLDLHEDDAFDEAQLTEWVKQASQLPGERVSGWRRVRPETFPLCGGSSMLQAEHRMIHALILLLIATPAFASGSGARAPVSK